jgi:hypothetical protein
VHQSLEFTPEVSKSLKATNRDTSCQDWVDEFLEAGGLLSAISRVAHPSLYMTGRTAFSAMRELTEIGNCVKRWSSVFSAVNIIVNRETPLHRDTGTLPEWFDILATIGGDSDTIMELPSIGARIAYRSGTVALFSGATIAHSVPAARADRVCFTYYMKNKIHERFGVKAPGWMDASIYSDCI